LPVTGRRLVGRAHPAVNRASGLPTLRAMLRSDTVRLPNNTVWCAQSPCFSCLASRKDASGCNKADAVPASDLRY
jgi:hypothetical protein